MEMALILYFVLTFTSIAEQASEASFVIVGVFFFAYVVCYFMINIEDRYEENKHMFSLALRKFPYKTLVFIGLLLALVPSRDDAIMILSGTAAYEVLTSDKAKQVGGLAVDVLIEKLNDELDKKEKQNAKQ